MTDATEPTPSEHDDDHVEHMLDLLSDPDIDHVFVEFSDINGISRTKQLRTDYFLDSWETGFPVNLLLLAQTPRNAVPEGSGVGEEIDYGDGRLRPLPHTACRLPWRDDAARVLCDVVDGGGLVGAAPRTALARVLESVPDEVDFEFTVGSELEFYLLSETESGSGYEPITSHKHECVSWATEEVSAFYNDLAAWSEEYGATVTSLMHEHGAGQLEVLFEYGEPMGQADDTFDFKRLVKQTGRCHDLWATFMAKPFGGRAGSGYHLHIGAFRDGENVFEADDVDMSERTTNDGEATLSRTGRQFVAGVVDHADALAALGTPTINGFKRYERGSFAPYTASWGYDNRMTGLRIPSGTTRIENRIPSADANPYLVIAATIAAGLDGIERDLEPEPPVSGDPAGDRPPLPQSPELALAALESDETLTARLGEDLIQAFVAAKRAELESFRKTVTDWEREQYVETL
ncbi:glutamine synthetase (plasmid) [Natrialba magadii ATCC 43099]|uniref:Glutamate--ammonia ligase n=1 Tax=Natrialba magadii (strain ATCC 43099 / DSM 3394 / CCM 3739 / CIP 104546 / IAM 13178 / JCM 8861 / NBRC 102185 / NCIMB 2190 / MS3) TaxID=547559 RepID=D3T1D9_NATMM|nr:glutamine synthetase family protein [Natrialba magadii]ADD07398.1 glutamine synthetase [Natrialba magadii ATCC 43099]ELY32422.1 glutamate--ammonia ligase [Natrialba magadii ATCC 43099]